MRDEYFIRHAICENTPCQYTWAIILQILEQERSLQNAMRETAFVNTRETTVTRVRGRESTGIQQFLSHLSNTVLKPWHLTTQFSFITPSLTDDSHVPI